MSYHPVRFAVCVVCHKKFQTRGSNVKYCPVCRPAAGRKQQRESNRISRALKLASQPAKPQEITCYDSEALRAICLSCTTPPEKCTGWCGKMREAKRKEASECGTATEPGNSCT